MGMRGESLIMHNEYAEFIDDYYDIELAIQVGDKAYAREILHDMIEAAPTARALCLAAQIAKTPQQRITLLEQALALEPDNQATQHALEQARQAPPLPEPVSLLTRISRIFS